MNTLTINSKAHEVLARAAEKARAEKPLVRKTSTYGNYEVRSTSNHSLWYKVTCNSETKEITCTCPARKPCKHIAAVAPLHSYIARTRQEAATQAAPVELATSVQEIEDLIEQIIEESDAQAVKCWMRGCPSLAECEGLCPDHANDLAADARILFG